MVVLKVELQLPVLHCGTHGLIRVLPLALAPLQRCRPEVYGSGQDHASPSTTITFIDAPHTPLASERIIFVQFTWQFIAFQLRRLALSRGAFHFRGLSTVPQATVTLLMVLQPCLSCPSLHSSKRTLYPYRCMCSMYSQLSEYRRTLNLISQLSTALCPRSRAQAAPHSRIHP
jgi:hypothetical protein